MYFSVEPYTRNPSNNFKCTPARDVQRAIIPRSFQTTVYNRLIKLMAPRTSTKQNSSAGNAWKAGLRFREPAAAIRAAREYAIIFNCAGEWRSRSGFPRPH